MKKWITIGLVVAALAAAGVVLTTRDGEVPGLPHSGDPGTEASTEHNQALRGVDVSMTGREPVVHDDDESSRTPAGEDPALQSDSAEAEESFEAKYSGWTSAMLAAAQSGLEDRLREDAEPLLQLKKDLGEYVEIQESSPHTFPPIDYKSYHTGTYPPILQAYSHMLPDGEATVMRIVTIAPKEDPALEALAEEISWLKSREKELSKSEGK